MLPRGGGGGGGGYLVATDLRCDPCMVRARQPQGGPACHACVSCHDVLQGHKDGVAHVQLSRHVGGRHGEDVGGASGRQVWLEVPVLLPPGQQGEVRGDGLRGGWGGIREGGEGGCVGVVLGFGVWGMGYGVWGMG